MNGKNSDTNNLLLYNVDIHKANVYAHKMNHNLLLLKIYIQQQNYSNQMIMKTSKPASICWHNKDNNRQGCYASMMLAHYVNISSGA